MRLVSLLSSHTFLFRKILLPFFNKIQFYICFHGHSLSNSQILQVKYFSACSSRQNAKTCADIQNQEIHF